MAIRVCLTYEEKIELIRKLQNGEGGDELSSKWVHQLEESGLYEISNLIFHDNRDLSPEEIYEEAVEKSKPIQL